MIDIRAISWVVFLVVGLWAAWKDVRERRVGNRWLLAGLGSAALLYAALALGIGWTAFGAADGFLLKVVLDAVLGAAAAIALWRCGLWPAGDAKLFIVFCLLVSLMDPNLRGFPQYLWLILLVNTFVIASLFILGLLVFEWVLMLAHLTTKDGQKEARAFADRVRRRLREEWPYRGRYVILVWNTFALFILFRLCRSYWQGSATPLENLALYAGFYAAWGFLSQFLARGDIAKVSFLIVALIVAPAGLFWKPRLLSEIWAGSRQAAGFWFLMPLGRLVINFYLDSTRRYRVEPKHLRPGLILSQESWQTLMPSVGGGAAAEPWTRYADGLSAEEVSWMEQNAMAQVGAGLEAHHAVPFAQWLFLGALWTVLQRKNVVECLVGLR